MKFWRHALQLLYVLNLTFTVSVSYVVTISRIEYNEVILTRISHEHSVNLSTSQKGRNISKKQLSFQMYTVFTEGQSRRLHLLRSFGNEQSLLLESVFMPEGCLPVHYQKLRT